MGCLSVDIRELSGIVANYVPTSGISTTFEKESGVDVEYTNLTGMDAIYTNTTKIEVNYYFICTVGTKKYLKVTPSEPLWITMDEMGVYTVRSNTDWIIL